MTKFGHLISKAAYPFLALALAFAGCASAAMHCCCLTNVWYFNATGIVCQRSCNGELSLHEADHTCCSLLPFLNFLLFVTTCPYLTCFTLCMRHVCKALDMFVTGRCQKHTKGMAGRATTLPTNCYGGQFYDALSDVLMSSAGPNLHDWA